MLLPLLILIFAIIPASIIAYGIDPLWAQYPHGIELILFTRRFQGPLIALTLILCIALIGLMIAGKRRAWWLIGLAPILALLSHRFIMNPQNSFTINTHPNFVTAEQARFMTQNDWIIGLIDGPDAVAFPFASLYSHPVVVRSNQPDPMMLMWSPFANCAIAERIDRSIRAEELEVVSMPANMLLIYNSRDGQFINSITAHTMKSQTPAGFISPISTIKTTWTRWLALHPNTVVLAPPEAGFAPQTALLPYFPMPKMSSDLPPETRIALIRAPAPAMVRDTDLTATVTNFSSPLVVIIRDPVTGSLVAFDRHVDEDLVPAFAPKTFTKFPRAIMTDADSNSAWTAAGVAIDGPLKGKKLTPVDIDDALYYNITRFWFRDPPLITPEPPPEIKEPIAIHPAHHHRKK